MYSIPLGNKTIGPQAPVFIIAELGYNFNTLEEALLSVDAAAGAGVDGLKIQTFRAETVATKDIRFPAEAGGVNQFDEFKKYEISEAAHRAIFSRAIERGVIPFSSPSHFEDVDLLERIGAPMHKMGSDDLTNLPLLKYVARKKKPVILSTGMATLNEIDEAIRVFHEAGNRDLVVLHCVSNYPIRDPGVLNMSVISSLRAAFPVLVGYSDHTTSSTAAVMSVALGSVAVERHFVLDKSLPVPDGFFSADPAEMKMLVTQIREAEAMRGDGWKRPMPTEMAMRLDTRKSLIARRLIRAGQTIAPEDLVVKRPGTGIPPREWDVVVGRAAKREIPADHALTWADV